MSAGECQASCRMACAITFVYAAPLFRVFDWLCSKAAWTAASRSGLSVAAAIGISAQTVFDWLQKDRLQGRQLVKGQPWQISLTDDQISNLQQQVRRTSRSK